MRRNRRITPEGTRDLLFEESLARREAEGRLADLFVSRGFSEVMTPGIEFYDVFHADTMAIPAENMVKFSDSKGRLLVLPARFDHAHSPAWSPPGCRTPSCPSAFTMRRTSTACTAGCRDTTIRYSSRALS